MRNLNRIKRDAKLLVGALLFALSHTAIAACPNPEITLDAPTTGSVYTAPGTISLEATATACEGYTIADVKFYRGTTLIATVSSAPYQYTWSSVAAGTYSITARATDNAGNITNTSAISVISNTPPTASLSAPANNAVVTAPATFTVTASASDGHGIAKVEFFEGENLIGTDTTSPYSISWADVPAGTYTITAKSTDNLGATTTSAARTVKSNAAPTVSMTSPAPDTVLPSPATITMSADAADSDGTIANVKFYRGTSLLATVYTAPYTYTWNNAGAGTYVLTARATDNNNIVTISDPVTVISNATPTVSLSAPANNAAVTAPATFTITASASDSGGAVEKVEFFEGENLIGTDTTSPYSISWADVPAGTYSITAKVTDNVGTTVTSSARTIKSNVAPTISLTSPVPDTVLPAPASFVLSADAADSDGTVSYVRFYRNGTLVQTDSSVPYTYNLNNQGGGVYEIIATVTDNNNAVVATAPITVTSNATPTVSMTGPTNNSQYNQSDTVTLSANAADVGGSIAQVAFYHNQPANTLIGTVTSAPYTLDWDNVQAGTYAVTAVATDNLGTTQTSAPINVVVGMPPTVSIVSPATDTVSAAPATFYLVVDASDTDGDIAKVEFFEGSNLIATSTAYPYGFVWSDVAEGSYTITAKATDDTGRFATSAPITVVSNTFPTVNITSPVQSTNYLAPADITITADASDSTGTITKVEFFEGSTLLATDTAAPYSFDWNDVPTGSYTLFAKATDNLGTVTTSSAVNISVSQSAPPTVSLTAPSPGTSYTQPASIYLTADAADTDGSIVQVSFYNGSTLLGIDTVAPYTYEWNSVSAGTYNITAIATDDSGATGSSALLQVAVINGIPQAYYVHTDHLNTPRLITDQSNSDVWRWDNHDPFGNNAADSDPNNTGNPFVYNLRFPGQYYDQETGLHYNYFRDYSAQEGRYIQSDPIGLQGGINTYAYVEGNPLSFTDPEGLEVAGSVQVGTGGSAHYGPGGASAESGVAVGSNGSVCFYTQVCGNVGFGLAGSLGGSVGAQSGELCSGTQESEGPFLSGGSGIYGGGQVTKGSDGAAGVGKGFGGIGAGVAGGMTYCTTRYYCVNEPQSCQNKCK